VQGDFWWVCAEIGLFGECGWEEVSEEEES
jgi:hypothetical protein